MNLRILVPAILATLLLFFACNREKPALERVALQPSWPKAQEYYLQNLDSALQKLAELQELGANHPDSKKYIKEARRYFKRAEPFASYLNPAVGHQVNGPPLPVYVEDSGRVMPAIGLQKIEESVYIGETTPEIFREEVKVTIGLMRLLRSNVAKREVTPQRFFVATHQQLLRIISFSITGFDTPTSLNGLEEAAVSLSSLKEVYRQTIQPLISKKNAGLSKTFTQNVDRAIKYLEQHPDFNGFDRFTFIKEYMNPITRNWVAIRKAGKLWEGSKDFAFNFDAPTFFEDNSFNVNFFLPTTNLNPTPEQIALGKKLFFDTNLSSGKNMSCATCHAPEQAYNDNKMLGLDNKGRFLDRNTPTLINSVYQKAYFWDGRSETLTDQIASVFSNVKEFNSSVHKFSDDILKDSVYIKLFKQSFGRVPNRNTDAIMAISSYISTLSSFNSKFDKNIRGEENTYTEEEKLGFNLFAGKALCATCHFIPLTNGTVPPFYRNSEREVIGVPQTSANKKLDADEGYYWVFKEDIHKNMFKTPTVRNAELTYPYMHNGAYNTLEEVVDFYNKGGGAGLGFKVPYQTLPFDNLQLTDAEQKALVAYMKTLTDTEIKKTY